MNVYKMMNAFETVEAELNNLEDVEAMTVVCMVIDLVAGRQGMKGSEMIQEILPILQDVNDSYGIFKVEGRTA